MAKQVTEVALRAAMQQAKTYMDDADEKVKTELESKITESDNYVTSESLEEKLQEYAKTADISLPEGITGAELTSILNEVFQASEAV